jgi:hypothetical protein
MNLKMKNPIATEYEHSVAVNSSGEDQGEMGLGHSPSIQTREKMSSNFMVSASMIQQKLYKFVQLTDIPINSIKISNESWI